MSNYFKKISITLVASLCLMLSSVCSLRAEEPSVEKTLTKEDVIRLMGLPDDIFQPSPDLEEECEESLEILRAKLESTRAEGRRLEAELARSIAESEQQMREDFATARAHARAVVESRGRLAIRDGELVERYEPFSLPEPSNHRWIVVLCVNGAVIASLFALYFYRRWQKSQSLS